MKKHDDVLLVLDGGPAVVGCFGTGAMSRKPYSELKFS